MDPNRDVWTIEVVEHIQLSPGYRSVYDFRCNGQYVTRAAEFDTGWWEMMHFSNEDMFRAQHGPEKFENLAKLMPEILSRWEDSPRKPLLA